MGNRRTPKSNHTPLTVTWGLYRTWAATSRSLKAQLSRCRLLVFVLMVIGAIFATLSSQIQSLLDDNDCYLLLSQIFAVISALSIGLATYFSKEILSLDNEQHWVRARSAAEAFKSTAYLYSTKISPYDTEQAGEILLNKIEDLKYKMQDLTPLVLTDSEQQERKIPEIISIEDYINDRVIEQIDNYYIPQASRNENLVCRGILISRILGGIGVILGVFAATFSIGLIAGWIAVTSAISTAYAAYFIAGKHQYLVLSYLSTAEQLKTLLAKWNSTPTSEKDKTTFVKSCEQAISIENNEWLLEYINKKNGNKNKKDETLTPLSENEH